MQLVAGRFYLIDLIARGGSGSVWRAWDLKAGKYCAAKVLKDTGGVQSMRLAREKSLRVCSSHLAVPYGSAVDDDCAVIAFELFSGGTLSTLNQKHGNLEWKSVQGVLRKILLGANALHQAGWVHRDIKPANILMRDTGNAPFELAIGDFGLAAKMGEPRLTEYGFTCGTGGYMAPEMSAWVEPAPAQDLYAIGRLGLFLLGGKQLLEEVDKRLGCKSGERAVRELIESVAPELSGVLLKLIASNPKQRYQSAEEALRDLPRVKPPKLLKTEFGEDVKVCSILPRLPARVSKQLERTGTMEGAVNLSGLTGQLDKPLADEGTVGMRGLGLKGSNPEVYATENTVVGELVAGGVKAKNKVAALESNGGLILWARRFRRAPGKGVEMGVAETLDEFQPPPIGFTLSTLALLFLGAASAWLLT